MTLAQHLLKHAREVGRFEFPVEETQALAHAAANFERNRTALEAVWPRTVLALPERLPELEWLYARDGSLSARHVDRRWVADASVPQKAAQRMFRKLIVSGSTAVLLAPTHAQQVRAVLDRMTGRQALIAVVPGEFTAGFIASCGDFSIEIAAGRLWLACGPDWAEELQAIFDKHEGLAPVSQMIRVPGLNAAVIELIQKTCDGVLAHHGQTHRQLTTLIHAKPRMPATPPRKLCVATGAFELWNDAASLLASLADDAGVERATIDLSVPTNASVLRLARTAEGCDAMVTAELGRADLPPIVPDNVPWVTWATGSRVPAYQPAATRDLLVIADGALRPRATAAGWPLARVQVAAEPAVVPPPSATALPAIVADLRPIVMPAAVDEMSSHRLVWDLVEHELTTDPLAWRGSIESFLERCAERVGVPRASFPLELFRDELFTPLFTRELARHLHRRGARFAIFGKGWEKEAELEGHLRGEVTSAGDLAEALRETSHLIDVWPTATTHRARRAGRPLVAAWSRDWTALLPSLATPARSAAATAAPPFRFSDLTRWLVTVM